MYKIQSVGQRNFFWRTVLLLIPLVFASVFFVRYMTHPVKNNLTEELIEQHPDFLEMQAKMEREVNMLSTKLQIEKNTVKDLVQQLSKTDDKAFKLRQEIAFYKNIFEQPGSSKGLSIQNLSFEKDGDHVARYSFRLVLTNLNGKTPATGTVVMLVRAERDGKEVTEDLKRFFLKSSNLNFKFDHFKLYEGVVEFPATFNVQKIVIALKGEKNGEKIVERIFSWKDITH